MSIPLLALRTGPTPTPTRKPTPSIGSTFGDLPPDVQAIVVRQMGRGAGEGIDPNSLFDLCRTNRVMRDVCGTTDMEPVWEKALATRGWALAFRYGLTSFQLYVMLHEFRERTIAMEKRRKPPAGIQRTRFLQQLVAVGNGVFGDTEEATDTDDEEGPADVRLDRENFNAILKVGIPLRKLPDRITIIGFQTFRGCKDLALVALPASLRHVGESAFLECEAMPLNEGMGDALVQIDERAFSGCLALNPPRLPPHTLRSIRTSAFAGCTSLVLDDGLPEGVTSIGNGCFEGCTSLTLRRWNLDWIRALAAGGHDALGYAAFRGCNALTPAVRITLQLEAPWVFYQ